MAVAPKVEGAAAMGLRIPAGAPPMVVSPTDGVAFTADEIAHAVGGPFTAIALSERFFRGDILFLHAENTFASDRTFNCPASDMISRDVWGAVLVASRHEVALDVPAPRTPVDSPNPPHSPTLTS